MGIPGGANLLLAAGGVPTYEIDQSLRFDGGSYLNWTPSSTGDTGLWSFSCWYKKPVKAGLFNPLFMAGPGNWAYSRIAAPDDWAYAMWVDRNGPSASYPRMIAATSYSSSASWMMRDPSAWYHVLTTFDDSLTANDRMKFYINGVETPRAYEYSNRFDDTFDINRNVVHRLGYDTGSYLQGYMAEVNFVDGTALDPTDFGEYDDNGVWRPIAYSGSYGSNGFYLKFDPSATNGIGHDHSGNGNHFTATGFTTSGTDTNVMSDTPTNNFATWNPLAAPYAGSPVYEEGNLYFDLNDSGSTISTIGVKSGKWYCEIRAEGTMSQRPIIGLNYINPTSQGEAGDRVWPGWDVAYAYNGNKWLNYSTSSYGSSWSNGDIIGIALDLDSATQTVTFYRNGTSQGAINLPASGKTWHVSVSSYGVDGDNLAFTANFGQRAFEYTQPTGYNSWCTANLPAPDIADGSDYFQTVLYTGNGSTKDITVEDNTGNTWQPDLVWVKGRTVDRYPSMFDAIRGAGYRLFTNTTGGDNYSSTSLTSFNSDGFSLGSLATYNYSGDPYVAWNWLGANGTSSNTSGSITSTVSANPSAGFSIVSYTGNGTSGSTVGHGLGVAPSMIITKIRSATGSWPVYHASQGAGKYGYLDTTGAFASSTGFYGGVAPTSTVYTIGNNARVNSNGNTFIAYCFAEVEGYSKFGSHTGNGSTDGAFIYLGFKPALIILKETGNANNWHIWDSTRSNDNPIAEALYPNLSASEGNPGEVDLLSNGFKIRTTNTDAGGRSGGTYIFAAFAEHPFGGEGVSPAPAR